MTEQEIMEQAQVFASSWSLVGSCFDQGDELENAEAMKEELRVMIKQLTEERDVLKAALEKLACLGNGDSCGNSVGNCIAQEALKGLK